MIGEGGDPDSAAARRSALVNLLAVFPEHIEKPRPPTWFDGDEIAQNDQFDAIVRTHKKDRLTIPIQALRRTGAPYHGFLFMNPRRLAWFVPSFLAAWLDGDVSASDLEKLVGEAAWTDEEATALDAFFEAALDASLAAPPGPGQERDDVGHERPREDGVRVWSLHSPSMPLEVLRVARAFGVQLDALVIRWALDPSELALDQLLLEAVYDTTVASKHFLADESVADRLGAAFFEATGERQARLSKAEAAVRRNIARREGV